MKTCEISTAIIEAHEQDGGLWQFRSVGFGQPQERHTTTLRVVGGRIEDDDGDGLDIYNPDTEWTRLFAVGKKARRQAERIATARARDAAVQEARTKREVARRPQSEPRESMEPADPRGPRLRPMSQRTAAMMMALLVAANGPMVTK